MQLIDIIFNIRNRDATDSADSIRKIFINDASINTDSFKDFGSLIGLDEDNDLYTRTNKEMVFTEELTNKYDVQELKELIQEHVALTNSVKGKEILDNFGEYLPKFKKVVPYDYHHMLTTIVQMEEKGYNVEQAQIEAFYANLEQQA